METTLSAADTGRKRAKGKDDAKKSEKEVRLRCF